MCSKCALSHVSGPSCLPPLQSLVALLDTSLKHLKKKLMRKFLHPGINNTSKKYGAIDCL